jgi:DNA-binding NtrC family response regulator
MQVGTALLNGSVLVVDDDIQALEEMTDALHDYGLTVHTASNQIMAMKLAYEHRPEFIIMDHFLRGYTGLESINDIYKFLPETRVIMISGFEDLFNIVTTSKGVSSCVIAVLKKPLPMDGIGRFISNQLEQLH